MPNASAAATSLVEVSLQDGKVFATWNQDALEALTPKHLVELAAQLGMLGRYAGLLAETALLFAKLALTRCRT